MIHNEQGDPPTQIWRWTHEVFYTFMDAQQTKALYVSKFEIGLQLSEDYLQ